MKKYVIVGSQGQDGRILKNLLTSKTDSVVYEIFRNSDVNIENAQQVLNFVKNTQADKIFYLPAYHHSSQDSMPPPVELYEKSYAIHVKGLLNFLEAIRISSPHTHLLYAASSLIFGESTGKLITEESSFRPKTIYGITKAQGVFLCQQYRREYEIFVACAYLFNHESCYRSDKFLSQKVVKAAVASQRDSNFKTSLGNLSAQVDWSDARDTVCAMLEILNAPSADDFVVASGVARSVKELVATAFGILGIDWNQHIVEDQQVLKRNLKAVIGDSSRLKKITSWKQEISFEKMITDMLIAAGGKLA
jgi:GDPmannose 4,6-dehydratase